MLKDLFEACDVYHFHLTSKPNVVGTAVGRYLRRTKPHSKKARTLFNSEVRIDSWPCILVFVTTWIDRHEFGGPAGKHQAYDIVPKTLFGPIGSGR